MDEKRIQVGGKSYSGIQSAIMNRRCLALTRYLKRLAKHPIICMNKTFLAFIQEKELPNTLKVPVTNKWGMIVETLTVLRSRIAFKEMDPWFQTKSAQLEEMSSNLKKLRKSLRGMSDLKVKLHKMSTEFRQNTVGLLEGRLCKERDLGQVINQGIECHKLGMNNKYTTNNILITLIFTLY